MLALLACLAFIGAGWVPMAWASAGVATLALVIR